MDKTKPQKSQFWIWTTLWLTTMLDSILIFIVFAFILKAITPAIDSRTVLLALALIARIISLWLGAYMAVKYVLKKTIIFKRDAQKLAFLAIVVPLMGNIIFITLSTSDLNSLLGSIVSTAIVLGIIYYSVKSLIVKHGSE